MILLSHQDSGMLYIQNRQEESETEPITGMDIESAEPEYYNRVIVNHSRVRNRVVNKKMIFLPISRTEIRKVKDLDQNPGWAN